MRIAIVSEVFLPAVDGVVTRLRHTVEELVNAGDEVMLVAPAGGPASYAGASVVGVRALPMPLYPDGDGYPEKRVALPQPSLWRALRRFSPDVVHCINPMLLAAGGVACARAMRLPLVASYHAHIPSYTHYYGMPWLEPVAWRYIRALHNRADVNLCTSQATLEALRTARVQRLGLWPYGVPPFLTARRDPSPEWRARLSGGRSGARILLYVGRLAKEKDVDLLLPAVRDVEGTALAIVGDGPLREELKSAFAGTATEFLGILTGEDLAAAYAAADAFVFPSRSETLGMVMLEAHAAGLPVIAAESAAARELVDHGLDGLRYDADAPGALAAAVGSLLGDPSLLDAMSARAGAGVRSRTWAQATGVLRGFYADAILRRTLARPPRGPRATVHVPAGASPGPADAQPKEAAATALHNSAATALHNGAAPASQNGAASGLHRPAAEAADPA